MKMPRHGVHKNSHDSSPTVSMDMVRKLGLVALVATSFILGTMTNMTNSLSRSLSQARIDQHSILNSQSTAMTTAVRRPFPLPRVGPTPGDVTNGRGWISPAEGNLMKERLRAVEKRLKSLQNTPLGVQKNLEQTEYRKVYGPRTQEDIQFCREQVFTSQQTVTEEELDKACNDPSTHRFNVCHDLADFTGLAIDEVIVRMARLKQFHYEEEQIFWNPQTTSQLTWFYSTSQSLLFANSINGARARALYQLKPAMHEPVLDFSGGVGNSVLYLALERGMKCQYFDTSILERTFAQFRVAKRGLDHMVSFLNPWSEGTKWVYDPINALPRDGSLGAILANYEALRHISDWRSIVRAMVDSLKVGGVIVEHSSPATSPTSSTDATIRTQYENLSLAESMGSRMVYRELEGYWEKLRL